MVKNFMEEYVKEQLDLMIEKEEEYEEFSTNDVMYKQALAKVLNMVKPSYFTTNTGEIYLSYDQIPFQARNDTITAIVKALEEVKKEKQN